MKKTFYLIIFFTVITITGCKFFKRAWHTFTHFRTISYFNIENQTGQEYYLYGVMLKEGYTYFLPKTLRDSCRTKRSIDSNNSLCTAYRLPVNSSFNYDFAQELLEIRYFLIEKEVYLHYPMYDIIKNRLYKNTFVFSRDTIINLKENKIGVKGLISIRLAYYGGSIKIKRKVKRIVGDTLHNMSEFRRQDSLWGISRLRK